MHPSDDHPAHGPRSDDPLAPHHLRELDAGRRRTAAVRRGATVAGLSGGTLVLFGCLTMLGAVFGSLTSLLLGAVLVGLGVNELRAGGRLRRLDPSAARTLAWNQVALAAVIAVYAGWRLLEAATADATTLPGGGTGMPETDRLVAGLRRSIGIATYGSVLVVGTAVPLLTARWYGSRGRHVRAMLAETPAWVVRTLRAAA